MIREKFIAILGVVLLGGAVAVGWASTALAEEISYSFEVRLNQRLGNLKPGDTLTGSWTVDTTKVDIPVEFDVFGFFKLTSFQLVDPQNGGAARMRLARSSCRTLGSPDTPMRGQPCSPVA